MGRAALLHWPVVCMSHGPKRPRRVYSCLGPVRVYFCNAVVASSCLSPKKRRRARGRAMSWFEPVATACNLLANAAVLRAMCADPLSPRAARRPRAPSCGQRELARLRHGPPRPLPRRHGRGQPRDAGHVAPPPRRDAPRSCAQAHPRRLVPRRARGLVTSAM